MGLGKPLGNGILSLASFLKSTIFVQSKQDYSLLTRSQVMLFIVPGLD